MAVWRGLLAVILTLGVLSGCVIDPYGRSKPTVSPVEAEGVRSILVVPVINNSVDVDAPDYFLSTISVPLAERGYYVFPVNLVKRVMEEEGLADANLVHAADPTRLGELYGADAILYVTIRHWKTEYIVLHAETSVALSYTLKSGKTGKVLWRAHTQAKHSSDSPSGSADNAAEAVAALVFMTADAAIQNAAPDYIPLAQRANRKAIYRLETGLPKGPYSAAAAAEGG